MTKARLDPGFRPMIEEYRRFQRDVAAAGSASLTVSVVRNSGCRETRTLEVFAEGAQDTRNIAFVERYVKTLLWCYGGWKIVLSGPRSIYERISADYAVGGAREFDRKFMSGVYERPFEVEYVENPGDIPATVRAAGETGRHLDGCRIGFDAGGSDRKVSAVIDGETVYSEEVVWHPKLSSDPNYQYEGIVSAFRTAAGKMPRVDAVGVSTAGVCIDNRVMVSSLFLKLSEEDKEKRGKGMYLDAIRELGKNIPIEVCNDGDVTALAGAMNLSAGNVLGIAMGTSEAGGYVDQDMRIMGWLNELAFAPVDMNPDAMRDEWSGDVGCGVKYFSQDGVIKLAPAAGIELDEAASPAEKLKVVQGLMAKRDPRARAIYETIGVYFGYAVAWYCQFYHIDHVLVMGRVTSGEGGVILLDTAREVLRKEFPEIAAGTELNIPDENARRVGQSIAAASLPALNK